MLIVSLFCCYIFLVTENHGLFGLAIHIRLPKHNRRAIAQTWTQAASLTNKLTSSLRINTVLYMGKLLSFKRRQNISLYHAPTSAIFPIVKLERPRFTITNDLELVKNSLYLLL